MGLGKQRKQDMTRKRSQGTLILEFFYLLVLFVLFSSCQSHQVLNEELANLKIMASIRQSSDSHEVLQNPNEDVRMNAARALGSIGTPEALKAVKEYESRQ